MAEIVGLISAIGTIAAAGYKVSRAISTACDDFGGAEANVKAIADDIKTVSWILRQIQSRFSGNARTDAETAKVLDEIVSRCKDDVGDIEQSLLPLIDNMNSTEPMSRRHRLRWLFAKSRICSQQATLGSLKLTLSLFLNTLQLSDGFIVEELKQEIRDAISQTKVTKSSFLNAEKYDQAAAEAYASDGPPENESAGQADTYTGSSPDSTDNNDSQATLVLSNNGMPKAMESCDDLDRLHHRTFNRSEFDVMVAISDDSFMRIAAHMALQRSVTAFALVVMNKQPFEPLEPTVPTKTSEEAPAPVNTEAATIPAAGDMKKEAPVFPTEVAKEALTTVTTEEVVEEPAAGPPANGGEGATTPTENPGKARDSSAPNGSEATVTVTTSVSTAHGGEETGTVPLEDRGGESTDNDNISPSGRFDAPVPSSNPFSNSGERMTSFEEYKRRRKALNSSAPTNRRAALPQPRPSADRPRQTHTSSDSSFSDDEPSVTSNKAFYSASARTPDPLFSGNQAAAAQPYPSQPQMSFYPPAASPQTGGYGGFYGSGFNPYSNYMGMYPNMPYQNPFVYQAPPPPPTSEGVPDPEVELMKAQLEQFKQDKALREEQEKQREIEAKIRRDAEEAFARRMEEMRRAQEEAKAHLERAKMEAEAIARAKLEAELRAAEERRMEAVEARKRAEREARGRLEAELKAERDRMEAKRAEEEQRRKEFEQALKKAEAAKKRSFGGLLLGRSSSKT
ncbi:hypothetical protein OQA88_2302 [Cercophora sp. LCS_1]